jgi:hypothetical protein
MDNLNVNIKTRIRDMICRINSVIDLEPEKLDNLEPYIEDLVNKIDKQRDLDLQLRNGLIETINEYNNNQIVSDDEFSNMLSQIRDDALIIYIKKAQTYKVYNPSDDGYNVDMLNNFVDDDNTKFRPGYNKNNGPVYEVVRDTHPQRLLITIKEDINAEKIQYIKQQIVEFTKKYKQFAETSIDNLKVYGNDNYTEFLVSNIQFKNIHERDIFVERFINYMRVYKRDRIADKIELRPPLGDIEGTRLYRLSSQKTPKDPTVVVNSLDHLVTSLSISGQPHLTFTGPVTINGDVHISSSLVNNGTIGTAISTAIGTSINSNIKNKTKIKKTISTFCRHIYDTKPDWFKEGNFVELDHIENAYKEYFGNEDVLSSVIAKQLKGVLYTESSRKTKDGKTKTYKKLVKRDALKNT